MTHPAKMWIRSVILGFLFLANADAKTALYGLPSFTMAFNVIKSDMELILLQDRLVNSTKEHLEVFYKEKIDDTEYGEGAKVDEVNLWSKLEFDERKDRFEVEAHFAAQLALDYSSSEPDESLLSQSIMELFLIEAFQGDHYWDLVHSFLSDEILEEITDVKVTVVSNGYVPNAGHDPSAYNDYNLDGSWTFTMTMGVLAAAFFFVVLVVMWVYLCFYAKSLWKPPSPENGEIYKEEYSTEAGSIEGNDVADDSSWMDDWANAITSIPLRMPIKKSARKANKVRHPAQQHNSMLDSINECGESVCSAASAASKKKKNKKKKSSSALPAFQESSELEFS